MISRNLVAWIFVALSFSHTGGASSEPAPQAGADVPRETRAGKVVVTKGEIVTIRIEGKTDQILLGDHVELSFSAGADEILVGTWQVDDIRGDGLVDATPIDTRGARVVDATCAT